MDGPFVVVGWPEMEVEFRNNTLHFCFRVTSIGFGVKWLRFLGLCVVGFFVSGGISLGGNVAKTLAGEGASNRPSAMVRDDRKKGKGRKGKGDWVLVVENWLGFRRRDFVE